MAKDEALVQLKKTRELEINEAFWNSIEVRLKAMGKSMRWLGEQTGMRAQSMTSAKYLKSTVNIFTTLRICRALNCTVEDLIYGSMSTTNNKRQEEIDELIESVKGEIDTNSRSVTSTAELFQYLSEKDREAVVVHVLMHLGKSPRAAIDCIERQLSGEAV